jgi:hypothetical protein
MASATIATNRWRNAIVTSFARNVRMECHESTGALKLMMSAGFAKNPLKIATVNQAGIMTSTQAGDKMWVINFRELSFHSRGTTSLTSTADSQPVAPMEGEIRRPPEFQPSLNASFSINSITL